MRSISFFPKFDHVLPKTMTTLSWFLVAIVNIANMKKVIVSFEITKVLINKNEEMRVRVTYTKSIFEKTYLF